MGDGSFGVAPLEPKETVFWNRFHPHVGQVLQPEDRAVVVVATGGPSNDLVERKWMADPLAPPGRPGKLVRRQDPAVRYERAGGARRSIAACRNRPLALRES